MALTTHLSSGSSIQILLIIGQRIPRDNEYKAAKKMTIERVKEGERAARYLYDDYKIDDNLDQPALLLVGSARSPNNIIDMRDPFGGVRWEHLRIRRLSVNSTSVTQPRDANVISDFF
jgi:hypothetical protein